MTHNFFANKISEQAVVDHRPWRHELHGIRGIAIFLVVSFHIFANGRVSGGIDIFLAITGFLAVPSLYRRAQRGHGHIALLPRFGGLARRLLVPLVPVLITIGLVGSVIIPQSQQHQMFVELRASALFAENIELIHSQLSYDAAGPDTSLVQHLWSTSIQMQFHLLMPFIFMVVTIPLMRLGKDPRKPIIGVLAVLTVVSFGYAWWYQGVHQQANYFSSLSRAWELTLSGIVGLVVNDIRLLPTVRGILSWVGLAMILSTGFIFDGASVFPGPQALLPVGGLLIFLIAGDTQKRWGANLIVQHQPVTFLADISYSLYLWHWPVIIFYLNVTHNQRLALGDAVIVLAISIVLGWGGKLLLEDKLAQARILRSDKTAVTVAIAIAVTLAGIFQAGIVWADSRLETKRLQQQHLVGTNAYPGARSITDNVPVISREPVPDIDLAMIDKPSAYSYPSKNYPELPTCVVEFNGPDTMPSICQLGDDNAEITVVLTGGSHVGQWWPAFENIAKKYGWRLILLERGACQLALDAHKNDPKTDVRPACEEWNRNAVDYLKQLHPDVVVTLATSVRSDDGEYIRTGARRAWSELEKERIPMVLLRDTPFLPFNPTECLRIKTPQQCSLAKDDYFSTRISDHGVPSMPHNSFYIDTAQLLCPGRTCPPTIGNVVVWRNSGHITVAYANSATQFFEQQLREFMPELFE